MRNAWRVLAFDVAAPLVTIAALVMIGVVLGWPQWWVATCPVLVLLIVEAVAVNVILLRRDAVTVGTDDERPGLRLAVTGLATAALVAMVVVGYTHWTRADRQFDADSAEVVRIATTAAEAFATFSPQNPTAHIDRAAALMAPEQAEQFKAAYAKTAADLARRNISSQASTVSAGVEAIGPAAASVAVIMHGTRSAPGEPPRRAVLAMRVTLAKGGGKGRAKDEARWQVLDVAPIPADRPKPGD